MEWFLQLATDLPFVFGLMITAAVFVLSIASFMLGAFIPGGIYSPHIGQILGRLISTLILVSILWYFGWFTAAGFTRVGDWHSWLPILLLLVYSMLAFVHAYFGSFRYDLARPGLAGVVAVDQITVGLVEESAYRGIVLYAFVRLWGDSSWGLAASVLLSALLFGAAHMIWAAFGKPVLQTTLMSLNAFQAGICYGAFVLASGSIWPSVVFHGLVNAAVNIRLIDKPDFKETASAGIWVALLNLPVLLYAAYLLWTMPPFAIIPNTP